MKYEGKCKSKHSMKEYQDNFGNKFMSCEICGVTPVSFNRNTLLSDEKEVKLNYVSK